MKILSIKKNKTTTTDPETIRKYELRCPVSFKQKVDRVEQKKKRLVDR